MGVIGLALASAIGFTMLAIVLFDLNRRELNGLGGRPLALSFFRAAIGAAVMSLVIWLTGRVVTGTLLFLLVGLVAGGITYLIVTWLLGGRELRFLWQIARSKTISA